MAARSMRGAIVVIVSIGSLLGFGVWAQLGSAGAAGPDTIQYVQQTGSGGTYIRYVPGDGSPATTQAVTGGGGCATPTVSGPPVLAFSARSYPNG